MNIHHAKKEIFCFIFLKKLSRSLKGFSKISATHGSTCGTEPFLHRTRKLPCIFAALFVCYSSRSRLRDSLLRPCFDFLLFFTTQTRPVHRETDSGDEKFITPINKIHNPILGYVCDSNMSSRNLL